jgi:hypothetical protein
MALYTVAVIVVSGIVVVGAMYPENDDVHSLPGDITNADDD